MVPAPVKLSNGQLVPGPGTPWIVVEVNSKASHAVFSAIRHPAVKLVVTHELAGRVLLNASLQSRIGDAVSDGSSSSAVIVENPPSSRHSHARTRTHAHEES